MRGLTRMLVWISGASAGIGAALAATIPYEAEIIDISRRGGTPGTHHIAADLADPASWPLVEQDFARRLARFDGDRVVFVHNAGTLTPLGPADVVDSAAYARNVLLNSAAGQVLGHAFLQAVADLSCEQHLVMLSSGAAHRPYEGESSYCAGKAALDQWVRVVGLEQQRRKPGCRVVAVSPGAVDTDMQDEIRASDDAAFPQAERFRRMKAAGELLAPKDAALGIWSLLDRDLENGAVVHLRDFA
ncbi:MAG TPA: SDR family NAD(P)-dependent oxidoreductase [Kribbella sp.]|nr:SDR family NAD(P)-dependent oxidoreductase [Kribbella sp.]